MVDEPGFLDFSVVEGCLGLDFSDVMQITEAEHAVFVCEADKASTAGDDLVARVYFNL